MPPEAEDYAQVSMTERVPTALQVVEMTDVASVANGRVDQTAVRQVEAATVLREVAPSSARVPTAQAEEKTRAARSVLWE